jgi:hypothetical protein
MTLDVALTIASKRDVELWPMCVAGSAGWSPKRLTYKRLIACQN